MYVNSLEPASLQFFPRLNSSNHSTHSSIINSRTKNPHHITADEEIKIPASCRLEKSETHRCEGPQKGPQKLDGNIVYNNCGRKDETNLTPRSRRRRTMDPLARVF